MAEATRPQAAVAGVVSDQDTADRIISDGAPAAPSTDQPSLTPHPGRSRGRAIVHTLLSKYALIGVWALMALYFYSQVPDTFGTSGTFSSIFGSQQVLVFLAMSALVTLVVGEFDLSVASMMGISATIIPVLAGVHGMNIVLACVLGVGAAVLAGVVNAFFVVVLDVSSFVVTLGMATLLTGIAQAVSGSTIVSVRSEGLARLSIGEVLGMPVSFYYGILLAVVLAYVLAWTPLGRSMIFVGANREVARLAGIRVQRVRFGAYVVAGVLAGLAGLILVATVGGFDSSTSGTYLLPALAAVFLGTAVVQPGAFNPIGTMIAIYFLTTGIFGLQLLGYSGWIQNVFYGAGLVVAVALAKIVRDRSRTA
ncbi:ABC transporter permease [Aeromicrobium wangtongii]|uniref:ABC transporter permease n=1 Tax=Aeromicrobium wangtongii TaxID=2969247 RepID=A0ABY5M5J1_9ACTN|nr:ABC transporter permease [Aeromicrobium wangtongii]MCD9199808.1 ABC transporter permease [Aeromicrobium wangtongii]UUP13429.1 ABC transporter permease [Aeromicrobium wangtongii]